MPLWPALCQARQIIAAAAGLLGNSTLSLVADLRFI